VNQEYSFLQNRLIDDVGDNIAVIVYYEYDVALPFYKKTLNRPLFSVFAVLPKNYIAPNIKYFALDPKYTLRQVIGLKGLIGDSAIWSMTSKGSKVVKTYAQNNFIFLIIDNESEYKLKNSKNNKKPVYKLHSVNCAFFRYLREGHSDKDNSCNWETLQFFEELKSD
jgi:hypothetical protein